MLSKLLKSYGLLGAIKLGWDVLFSRLLYGKNIRKMRFPVFLLNKKQIFFGKNFTSGSNLRIEVFPNEDGAVDQIETPRVVFGQNVKLNNNVHIGCVYGIKIGNDVLVGSNVLIIDHDHGNYSDSESILQHPDDRKLYGQSIEIDDSVWIGENACILPGSKIGKGSVIGAMSLVKGKYPPYSIIVGNRARIIKTFNPLTKEWIKQ